MPLASVVRPPQPSFQVKTAVERAFRAADLNIECAAAIMGILPTQLSRQLIGREHLSFQRLVLIDDARFWKSLGRDIAAHFGVRSAIDELKDDMRALKLALIPTRAVHAEMREKRAKEIA